MGIEFPVLVSTLSKGELCPRHMPTKFHSLTGTPHRLRILTGGSHALPTKISNWEGLHSQQDLVKLDDDISGTVWSDSSVSPSWLTNSSRRCPRYPSLLSLSELGKCGMSKVRTLSWGTRDYVLHCLHLESDGPCLCTQH